MLSTPNASSTNRGDSARLALSLWAAVSRPPLGLILLFIIEFVLFYTQLADQILPYYPQSFDQTGYFVATYDLLQRFHDTGWRAFLYNFANPAATGITFPIQGMLLSLIGGPSRGAILTINLLYFICLQLILYATIMKLTSNSFVSWTAIALMLSTTTLFNVTGGIFDYRMDYCSLCLYGVWCCLVVLSRGFRDGRAIVSVGLVGSFLILVRFIAIVYIESVLGALFLVAIGQMSFSMAGPRRAEAFLRARNIIACGALTAALSAPFLFVARNAIFNYYVVGHIINSEKTIRAAEAGVVTLFDNLSYYPWNLVTHHLGNNTVVFAAVLLAIIIVTLLVRQRGRIDCAFLLFGRRKFEFVALAFSILTPLTLLTFDLSKSPVVGGIVVVPCIVAFALVLSALWVPNSSAAQCINTGTETIVQRLQRYRLFLPTICVAVGLAMFISRGTGSQHYLERGDLRHVENVNRVIAEYVIDNAITNPAISVDRVVDYLYFGTVQLYGYEHRRRLISFVPKFGAGAYGIFGTPHDVAMKLLQESDIVILTDPIIGREGSAYPMDATIREYWADMWRWTTDNLVLFYTASIDGIPYHVFHKPSFKVEGGSGEWITSRGLTLTVGRSELTRWPYLVLEAPNNNATLGGEPRVRATLVSDDGKPTDELPATIQTRGASYRIVIDLRAAAGPSDQARIQLTFDRFFVPKQRGINSDTRELVMALPTLKQLRVSDN